MQFYDLKVVATSEHPLANSSSIYTGRKSFSISLALVITQTHSDGTISVAKCCSPCLHIRLLSNSTRFIRGALFTICIKGITQACLETCEARRLVLDHVVVASGNGCAKGGTVVSLHEAGTKGATSAGHVKRGDGCLTTKGQLTPIITG